MTRTRLLPLTIAVLGVSVLSGCVGARVDEQGDTFEISTASPDTGASTAPESTDCEDVSPEALAGLVEIVRPANDGDTVNEAAAAFDAENDVWLVSGIISGSADDETVALWATEDDPTSSDFAGEYLAAEAGAEKSTAEAWDVTLTAEEIDAATACVRDQDSGS